MTETWESSPLVEEVWESNTTPGVEWRTVYSEPSTGGDPTAAIAAHNSSGTAHADLRADVDGKARAWITKHVGSFGPGFDFLASLDLAPIGALPWGDDYYYTQTPSGGALTVQAAAGETILCSAYLGGDFQLDHTLEGIWTLTEGEWVRDADQPAVGEIVAIGDGDGQQSSLGATFVKEPGGQFEFINLQFVRGIIGRSSVIEAVTSDGVDGASLSGAKLGASLIDATAGPLARTLQDADAAVRGLESSWVKVDASANAVTISPASGDTINGSTDPIVLSSQWDWVTMLSDGDGGWVVTGGSGDAPEPVGLSHPARENASSRYDTVPAVIIGAAGTYTLGAHLHYFPFVITAPLTFDRLRCNVQTGAAAGKLLQMGLWTADADFQPDEVVYKSETLPADSTGEKTSTAGSPVTIPAGAYLMIFGSDGTPTMRYYPTQQPQVAMISGTDFAAPWYGWVRGGTPTLPLSDTPGVWNAAFGGGFGHNRCFVTMRVLS